MATTTYPFEFFCEERWTLEEILEDTKEFHKEAKEFIAEWHPEAKMPSLLNIAEAMQAIYPYELCARAALRNDVSQVIGPQEKINVGEQVRAFPGEDLEEKILAYTDETLDSGQNFDLESEFGVMFIRDVEVALKLAELPYVPLAHDETDFWSPQM